MFVKAFTTNYTVVPIMTLLPLLKDIVGSLLQSRASITRRLLEEHVSKEANLVYLRHDLSKQELSSCG